MADMPVHIERFLAAVRRWEFSAGFQVPATWDELVFLAPELAQAFARCSGSDMRQVLRALGEAEATMLYDRCDRLMEGEAASPADSRRVFLRSLEQRLRKSYERRRPAARPPTVGV